MKKEIVLFVLLILVFGLNIFGKTELIPRKELFKPGEFNSPMLSPDGKILSFIKPSDKGIPNIWFKTLADKKIRMITNNTKSGIGVYKWSYDGKYILLIQDKNGDENYHLYSLDLNNNILKDLTPFPGSSVEIR